MTKITQSIVFNAAHRLWGYQGNCGMLHGHSWCVDVELESDRDLDKCGMFIDYRVIKQYFKEKYDHKTILNSIDPLVSILREYNNEVTILSGNPTAENLAKIILSDFVAMFNLDPKEHNDYCTVVVHESRENSAEEYL